MSKSIPVKVRAGWAIAGDPDPGRRQLATDGKSGGVRPIEALPIDFRATIFDGTHLHGTIPEPPKYFLCGGDMVNVNGFLMCENHMEPGGGWS